MNISIRLIVCFLIEKFYSSDWFFMVFSGFLLFTRTNKLIKVKGNQIYI